MSHTWKTVRVFISSTFRDMHAERDHLVKVVFPALRERLEKYRIHLIDIDLRWGVTREQAENDLALDLCLQQIDECRPFFIGILGERYGWVPTRYPADALKRFGWIQHHTGKSVTELEILHGVLQDSKMRGRAFFYFRDPVAVHGIPEAVRRDVYVETDAESIRKLDDLKRQICFIGYPVMENYPARWAPEAYDRPSRSKGRLVGLDAFGERVREQLWDAIKAEHNLPEVPLAETAADPLAEEQDYHERFMESRLRVYVGRKKINDDLFAFVDGNDLVPCMVTGPSGSGKSAALARFFTDYENTHQQEIKDQRILVIPHFIGASPRSTNLRDMLRRFCQVFKARFGFADDVPEEATKLSVTFREFVAKVPADTRVLLVIDALNQLDEADRAQELHWLPTGLPPQVKVIVSCITDSGKTEPALEAFRSPGRKRFPVQLTALSAAEQQEIIHQVPSLSAKTLDELQTGLLLSNPATENPLFLLVALEELRGFGSFEQLDGKIAKFPHPQEQEPRWHRWLDETRANARTLEAIAQSSGDEVEAKKWRGQLDRLEPIVPLLQAITPIGDTVTAIFTQVIERLEKDFEKPKDVVQTILTLLASARRGLSERELLDLVEGPCVKIAESKSDLFPVLRQLRPYLLSRAGLIDFYHTSIRRAVEIRHLLWRTEDNQLDPWVRWNPERQTPAREPTELERETRQRLVNFFETSRLAPRSVDELPWQLAQLRNWQQLSDHLRDLSFFEAAWHANRYEVRAYWALVERSSHRRLLDAFRGLADAPVREENSDLVWNIARLLEDFGHADAALALWRAIIYYGRRTGDQRRLSGALGNAAIRLKDLGKLDEALGFFEEQERICKERGDWYGLQNSLGNQGLIAARQNRVEDALSLHRAKEAICRKIGHHPGIAGSLGNQALLLAEKDPEAALVLYWEETRISRMIGDRDGIARSLRNQALVCERLGTREQALALLRESERECQELGSKVELVKCLMDEARIVQGPEGGGEEEALHHYGRAEAIYRDLGDQKGLARCLHGVSRVHISLSQPDEALACLDEAQDLFRECGLRDGFEACILNRAVVVLGWDEIGAMQLLRAQETRLRECGNDGYLVQCLLLQTPILIKLGQLEEALAKSTVSEALCRTMGDGRQLALSVHYQAEIRKRKATPGSD